MEDMTKCIFSIPHLEKELHNYRGFIRLHTLLWHLVCVWAYGLFNLTLQLKESVVDWPSLCAQGLHI